MARGKTTRRQRVVAAIADRLKLIDGTGDWKTNLAGNVDTRMRFIDEISDYPYVCVVAGRETREYQGAGFRWRDLEITLTIYVAHSDSTHLQDQLEWAFEDIETQLDDVTSISYVEDNTTGGNQIVDITVLQLTSDQGAFAEDGLAIGEMVIEVRY